MAGVIKVDTDALFNARTTLSTLQSDLSTLQSAVGSVWTNIEAAIQLNGVDSMDVDSNVSAATTAISGLSTALTNIYNIVNNVYTAAENAVNAL